jgi:hypothetical protein
VVATGGGRLVGELQAKGGIWAPFPAGAKNPLAMALNVRRLAKLCLDEGATIIHARSRAPRLGGARHRAGAEPAVRDDLPRQLRRPLLVKLLYNSVMARGDVVIANSHFTAEVIRSVYPAGGGAHPGHPSGHRPWRLLALRRSRPSASKPCAAPGASPPTSAWCCLPPG